MAYAIIGLLACLVAGWVWAEYNNNNPATRITLGGAVMLALAGFLFASAQSNFIRNAHYDAAIRMLGEAINDGDIAAARDAIHEYNSQKPRQTGHVIVSLLADRTSTGTD